MQKNILFIVFLCYYVEKGGFDMKQTDWKIVYSSYTGAEKHAVNLLSKETGRNLIREKGEYRLHVLPCEKEGCSVPVNGFFVGCYNESKVIKNYVKPDEVPENGYLVKVIKNPDNEEGRFVILTAHTKEEVFYAAVSFLDDYVPQYAPRFAVNPMPDWLYDKPLPECSYTEISDNKTRSIFTWGHSTNNYREYIDNMARQKFNELVLWNDYIPVNIEDIIDYAHSYGIKVVLGYSWGWKEIAKRATSITPEEIEKVKELSISEYVNNYSAINCDGIYFQSFTERKDNTIEQGKIAKVVTDMVNDIAAKLWEITPDLRIIFGLHASSVKDELDIIEKVNPRMEILWEDCGDFPYNYETTIESEETFAQAIEFTKKLLNLRGGKGVGLAFKGVMMLNWDNFIYQPGPYVMGENSPEIADHDRAVRTKAWKIYSAEWIKSGKYAHEVFKVIKENKLGEVNMCMAGTFDGGIYFPVALCAQMFRNCDEDYEKIVENVMRRECVNVE